MNPELQTRIEHGPFGLQLNAHTGVAGDFKTRAETLKVILELRQFARSPEEKEASDTAIRDSLCEMVPYAKFIRDRLLWFVDPTETAAIADKYLVRPHNENAAPALDLLVIQLQNMGKTPVLDTVAIAERLADILAIVDGDTHSSQE